MIFSNQSLKTLDYTYSYNKLDKILLNYIKCYELIKKYKKSYSVRKKANYI